MAHQSDKGITQELINIIRRNALSYDHFNRLAKRARDIVGLKPARRSRKLVRLLTADQLTEVMRQVERPYEPGDDRVAQAHTLRNTLILRMLFYTAVRVAELCAIKLADVDLAGGRVFIDDGKGHKDRYVVFPQDFRLVLSAYMQTLPDGEEWLFPSRYRKPMSTRWVQKILAGVGKSVGVRLHPHLMRHQMLTELTKGNMTSAKIRLISGHASDKSLAHYQQLALPDVQGEYEALVGKVKL